MACLRNQGNALLLFLKEQSSCAEIEKPAKLDWFAGFERNALRRLQCLEAVAQAHGGGADAVSAFACKAQAVLVILQHG